jgi:hypothetical protein
LNVNAAPGQPDVRRLDIFKTMKRLPPRDVTGEQLKVGDIVRVIGVPDLAGMSADCLAESLPVFQHLVGKYKRVAEFDEYGMAWLSWRIRKGPSAGFHSVGIEPHQLRVRHANKL